MKSTQGQLQQGREQPQTQLGAEAPFPTHGVVWYRQSSRTAGNRTNTEAVESVMDLSPAEHALSIGLEVTRNLTGSPVTYSRSATSLTVADAVQGDSLKRSIEVGGSEQVVEVVEWFIDSAALSALTPVTPERGDTIARVVDGTTHTYTVEDLDLGIPMWDWSDTGKTQFVIRTRKDGASAYEVVTPSGFDLAGNEMRPA